MTRCGVARIGSASAPARCWKRHRHPYYVSTPVPDALIPDVGGGITLANDRGQGDSANDVASWIHPHRAADRDHAHRRAGRAGGALPRGGQGLGQRGVGDRHAARAQQRPDCVLDGVWPRRVHAVARDARHRAVRLGRHRHHSEERLYVRPRARPRVGRWRPDCAGDPTQTGYYFTAEPLTDNTGRRAFATAQGGAVWQDTSGVAPPEPFVDGGTISPLGGE